MDAYRRYFGLAEVPTVGYFRYRDIFQILPPPPDAPLPPAETGAYPFIIELSYQVSTVDRKYPRGNVIPASAVNTEIAQEKLKHILLLLTVFSNFRMFIPSNHQGWFVSHGTFGNDQGDRSPQWGQECYFIPGYQHPNMNSGFTEPTYPPSIQSDHSTYFTHFSRSVGQTVDFPNNISDLLDTAHMISEDAQQALLAACSLLDQGIALWQAHPSLSFASCVSSLETLIAFDHKGEKTDVCQTCGQKRFSVMNKFQEFFRRYASQSPEFRKYAQKVYKYRSRILHQGELFLGDVFLEKFASMDGFSDRELHGNLIRTCRICIVNWVVAMHLAQPIIPPDEHDNRA